MPLTIPTFQSCLDPTPSIRFGTGTPINIEPNLPQSNAFSAYGKIPINLPAIPNVFTDLAKKAQTTIDPFFALIMSDANPLVLKTDDQLLTLLRQQYASVLHTTTKDRTVNQNTHNPLADGYPRNEYPGPLDRYGIPYFITETRTVTDTTEWLADMKIEDVLTKVKQYNMPRIVLVGNLPSITFVPKTDKVTTATPQLFVIEEYRMASYLGKYGQGRVVKTFSLLPGEKATMTIKTYHDITSVKSSSQNVMDSFSQTSANEMEQLIQQESALNTTNSQSDSLTASLSLSYGLGGVGFGASGSLTSTSNSAATRASNTQKLNKALEKHVNNSNASRQIQVNTSTTETTKDTEETSTTREVSNINKSRVLNFIFRQLHQQYLTVTYLANIKLAFYGGYEESLRVFNLSELDTLLNNYIVPSQQAMVKRELLKNYCSVRNYKEKEVPFIEEVTQEIGKCFDPISYDTSKPSVDGKGAPIYEKVTYWRKKPTMTDTNLGANGQPMDNNGVAIAVDGVILGIQDNTLKTSSVLVEGMLGQADTLDCFNLKIQDAESQKSYIDNYERMTRLENESNKAGFERLRMQAEIDKMLKETEILELQRNIVDKLGDIDRVRQAEMYKKVFGTCCDTPQTVIGTVTTDKK